MTALDVFLAQTDAAYWVARWRVVVGALYITVARLAAMWSEIVEIIVAAVTLFARHTRFALAFALGVTLQRPRSYRVTIAVYTVAVIAHVEVLLAAFTMRSISVGATVDTMATVLCLVVQLAVEEALLRVAITVASCGGKERRKNLMYVMLCYVHTKIENCNKFPFTGHKIFSSSYSFLTFCYCLSAGRKTYN
jgi:hypothetical protein